ncbi:MAG TPA: VOC family protein [Candidatus Saccharimonadales bacterium]|nr:VOC family protein [Candidatus Saccharimonadales bacterium]
MNDQKDTTNRLQIELHVPDFGPALEFYGKLGFKKVWMRQEHNVGDYLVMERDGTILNFWPGNDEVWSQSYFKRFSKDTKRGYGVEIVIPVDDIAAYYDQVKQFANVSSELKLQPWGVKDFRIEDPFGFYLRITERHNILDPKFAVPKEER